MEKMSMIGIFNFIEHINTLKCVVRYQLSGIISVRR